MEKPQVHHKVSRFLLLCTWMVLCCVVTVVRSDRVMWVDAKGEDGPQCIHHTPVGALMAQPPPSRSCRSLHYALQNTLNTTSIKILCGTHEYFKSPEETFPTKTLNVQLMGECTSYKSIVQCVNGTNLAFYNLANVLVRELVFEYFDKQSVLQLDRIKPNLDISNCTNVRIENISIRVTVPRGTGISLKHTDSNGEIILQNISILHDGTHGIGIQCEILRKTGSLPDSLTLAMNHILVVNTNTNATYDTSMAFTGIMITTHGTGNGSHISMHNITVFNSAPVMGYGIFVQFSDEVHNNTVNLAGVNISDGWDKHYHSRSSDEVLTECGKRQIEMMKGVSANYSAIMIEVQTSKNKLNVTDVQVTSRYAPSGSAAAVNLIGPSRSNRIHLGNISLAATGNTIAKRQGLDLQFAGSASENEVLAEDLQVANSTAEEGGGALMLFTDHCLQNRVVLSNSRFTSHHSSKYGGGLCALFQGYSQSNQISLKSVSTINSTTQLGGGVLLILEDFSRGNTIHVDYTVISGNRAITNRSQLQFARCLLNNEVFAGYGVGLLYCLQAK